MEYHMKLSELAQDLDADAQDVVLLAVRNLRIISSIESNAPITALFKAGIIPKLVECLSHPLNDIASEAAWTLTNLISKATDSQVKVLIDHGAVPIWIRMLDDDEGAPEDIKEFAAQALGDIAGSCLAHRDFLLDRGVISPLLAVLNARSAKLPLIRRVTWAFSFLVRGRPKPSFQLVEELIPSLAKQVFSNDDEVLANACFALSCICDGGQEDAEIEHIVRTGICRRLVELMISHHSPSVNNAAMRTVASIVTGNNHQTQTALNCGALSAFLHLLQDEDSKIMHKEVCWAVSNVTAGNCEQIAEVIESGLIERLVEICAERKSTADFETRKEATWAISNAVTGGNNHQVSVLVGKGCATALCGLLDCIEPRVQIMCMDGMERILQLGQEESTNPYVDVLIDCDGAEKLLKLARGQNVVANVREKAVSLLQLWDDECDLDALLATGEFELETCNSINASLDTAKQRS